MIIKKYVQSMGGYMIKIENFDNVTSSGITYGGHSGSKKGIILNNERWFLKYPKSTKSMEVEGISYTTAPLSEYLGSNIYKMIGLDVHDTKLGMANGKVVVACKDFLGKNETILDYNSIKNDYDEVIEKVLEDLMPSKGTIGTDIYEILIVMDNNNYFEKKPELRERFWDMFIVDALINNNDRNDNNWGLIVNHDTLDLRLAPIYDNGASFYSKSSPEKIEGILKNDFKIKQVIYDSAVSTFLLEGKVINPLKYIESMMHRECNEALLRIFPRIDITKINELIMSIPSEYNGITIMSDSQKELYFKSIEYKYNNVFKKIYDKLNN